MFRRKYRRIIVTANSKPQGYQYFLIAFIIAVSLTIILFYIRNSIHVLEVALTNLLLCLCLLDFICLLLLFLFMSQREEVSTISIPAMTRESKKLARQLKRVFNDKNIIDVLKLSNFTRYGIEMPEISVWISENLSEGFIAIENFANWQYGEFKNYKKLMSGILSGKFQKFAVINYELTAGDSFIKFYFEDILTSQRLIVKDNENSLQIFVREDSHTLLLAKDLVWHTDVTPMMSIIARTRAGKSVFAGRYLARLMSLQGWIVEYNSAKYDRYVKEFNGESEPIKIVERAEYWCSVMDKRLAEINDAGKEKYHEMDNMPDIGLFFDELGNLNASLESLDKVNKSIKMTARWINAINKLSATGASTGIHIIAISQFATKEGFLPSLARVNCSDAVIMLGGAADSADERKYLMSGYADIAKNSYGLGQGLARIAGSGKKWETPHFFETPFFEE
ncbi:DNA segregation ATPase FtsK/SpoIIIE related protein [Streptococcus pneumoniae]|nr:DNA segregation ATPase FtsK/SpoIIIE related protein [Streptococcus pneumoniae]